MSEATAHSRRFGKGPGDPVGWGQTCSSRMQDLYGGLLESNHKYTNKSLPVSIKRKKALGLWSNIPPTWGLGDLAESTTAQQAQQPFRWFVNISQTYDDWHDGKLVDISQSIQHVTSLSLRSEYKRPLEENSPLKVWKRSFISFSHCVTSDVNISYGHHHDIPWQGL